MLFVDLRSRDRGWPASSLVAGACGEPRWAGRTGPSADRVRTGPAACAAGVALALLSMALPPPAAGQAPGRPDCHPWQACRDQALEAVARRDFEASHDLAWRAVQTGPPRLAELMLLLARAQSLSGRPHDALVMLRRIVEIGVLPAEALSSDDFRRVRALADWPDLERRLSAMSGVGTPAPAARAEVGVAPPPPAEAPPTRADADRDPTTLPAPPRAAAAGPALASPMTPPPAPIPAVAPDIQGEVVLRFPRVGLEPAGFAFDRVSGRFLVGAARERKVIVINEQSARVIDLVRAESAGFEEVLALEIDARRGDLWVASATDRSGDGAAAPTEGGAALHKLQLVSGRPLATITAPAADRPVRFDDIAVAPSGAVLALDGRRGRVYRLAPRGRTLQIVAAFSVIEAVGLAITDDERHAYLAHGGGVSRLDLHTGRMEAVRATNGVRLEGLERVRWYEGSLVTVQRTADDRRRIVRVRLTKAGTTATGQEALDTRLAHGTTPAAVAISGSELYYLTADGEQIAGSAPGGADGARELTVRRVTLR